MSSLPPNILQISSDFLVSTLLIDCVKFQKDVEKLFESYTNITNKYRKLLEEESLIQQSTQKVHELQDELRRTQAELEDSQKKLAVQTQRFANILDWRNRGQFKLKYHGIFIRLPDYLFSDY